MTDPIEMIRTLCGGPREAIRWSCLLEATAPKAGNVYPGRTFEDLAFVDFVAASEIAAKRLGSSKFDISQRMFAAVDETVSLTKTNVNLGIILLLGPLVAADEAMNTLVKFRSRNDVVWKNAIEVVLKGFGEHDGTRIFQSISRASAGGLGEVKEMDVHNANERVDIIKAMKLAADRDRIARQYAGGYTDLIDNVVPLVWESIAEAGDVLTGISQAHLRLLALSPDTLIARKNGNEVAIAVQKRAQKVDLLDPQSIAKFDASLRSNTHKLNPGTTADLIAGALYVLIRTPTS